MYKELLNRRIKITMKEGDSEVELYNRQIVDIKDNLITVNDGEGKAQIINTHSSAFIKVELDE